MARLRKSNLLKNLGMFLIITAGVILIYPFLTGLNASFKQEKNKEELTRQDLVAQESKSDEVKEVEEVQQAQSKQVFVPWATLEIPDIGISVVVLEGTAQDKLAQGPGWYTQSALPGKGNTAIAGHNTIAGPFRNLHKLEAGSVISLTYRNQTYRYRVEAMKTIESTDWSLIYPCGYNALTLTTCTPEGRDKRLAVRARMI